MTTVAAGPGTAAPAPTARGARPTWRRAVPPVLGVLVVLAVWQAATAVWDTPAWMLPSPSAILAEAVRQLPHLGKDVAATARLTAVGSVLGVAVGLAVATVLHVVQPLREAVYPLLVISQNVPTITLAPLLVIWFGFGTTPKLVLIVLVVFFPVAVAAMDGLRQADPLARDYLLMSGAGRWQVFRLLEAPAAVPSVTSGLKIAATYAVMGAVVAEWVGSDRGLGHYMLLQKSAFRADRVFVAIILIVALSLLLFGAVALLERRLTVWRPRER